MLLRRKSKRGTFPLVLALVAFLASCVEGGATTAETAGEPGAAASGVAEKSFPEAVEDDECALLTAADVAPLVGVDASELEQRTVSGCLYSWGDGSIYLNASVYDTVERSRQWFERFTQDASAEEIAEAKSEVADRLAEKREEGEISESDEATAGALTDMMSEEAITETAVEGLGNEASLESSGSLRVRYGNLMFEVVARRGEENEDDPDLAVSVARIVADSLEAI